MKLSLVFELLLIFVLLAFAASRVIDSKSSHISRKGIKQKTKTNSKNRQQQQDVNKYCSCSTKTCNCCREFNIPVVKLQGPGCASLQYLQGDRLAVSMSFGDRVLSNTTVSGKKPKPVCMPLPGGVSKFCGRVYNIAREGEEFKACLGLELRALKDVEASLRVSCFRFGPNGLRTEAAQPLPIVTAAPQAAAVNSGDDEEEEEEEDDDYEYDFDEEYENDVDSSDYSSFGVFDDDFVGNLFGDGGTEYVVEVDAPVKPTKAPARKNTRKPAPAPAPVSKKPTKKTTSKPDKVKTTNKRKESSTSSTTKITVPTTSKPETPTVVLNSISNDKLEVSSEASPISTHDSIAAVTAMLQNLPADVSKVKPTKLTSIVESSSPPQNNEPQTKLPTLQEITETPSNEKVTNTESYLVGTTEEDDEDDATETVENYIIKDSKDEEEEDEDDDDDDDVIDDDIITAPISSVVEEVLGEQTKQSAHNKTNSEKKATKTKKKPESMLDDIVDGVVQTFTGEETKKVIKKQSVKNKDKDDDFSDESEENDEEDDEDDDDDEEEDEEDDDDDARNLRFKSKSGRSRQSKDMRLSK